MTNGPNTVESPFYLHTWDRCSLCNAVFVMHSDDGQFEKKNLESEIPVNFVTVYQHLNYFTWFLMCMIF